MRSLRVIRVLYRQKITNQQGARPLAAIARWCIRHRLIAVLVWLLALGGAATAAGFAGSAYSNDYEVPGTESGRATELLRAGFTDLGGDTDTIVWHTTDSTVRAADVRQTMTRTLHAVEELPGVGAVTGPYGASGTAQISADGHTAYATITFDRQVEEIPVQQARAVVDTAKTAAADHLQVELGGPAVALTEAPSAHLSEAIGVVVAAVVLFLAFGSLAASMLPIATALVSVGTAYAGTVLLGHVMTVADFAPMLGMLIGLGVGIDYALFIVTRHRRGLRRGLSVTEAAQNAVATTGRAVVFAGATVCIALLGMLILRLGFLNGVAIAASLTVVLTVAASVTLLPALLSLIGMRALVARARAARRARPAARISHGLRRPLVSLRRTPPQAARGVRRRGDAGPGAAHVLPAPGQLRPGQQPRLVDHPAGVRPAGRRIRPRRQRPPDDRRAAGRRGRPARDGRPARHAALHRGRGLGQARSRTTTAATRPSSPSYRSRRRSPRRPASSSTGCARTCCRRPRRTTRSRPMSGE